MAKMIDGLSQGKVFCWHLRMVVVERLHRGICLIIKCWICLVLIQGCFQVRPLVRRFDDKDCWSWQVLHVDSLVTTCGLGWMIGRSLVTCGLGWMIGRSLVLTGELTFSPQSGSLNCGIFVMDDKAQDFCNGWQGPVVWSSSCHDDS